MRSMVATSGSSCSVPLLAVAAIAIATAAMMVNAQQPPVLPPATRAEVTRPANTSYEWTVIGIGVELSAATAALNTTASVYLELEPGEVQISLADCRGSAVALARAAANPASIAVVMFPPSPAMRARFAVVLLALLAVQAVAETPAAVHPDHSAKKAEKAPAVAALKDRVLKKKAVVSADEPVAPPQAWLEMQASKSKSLEQAEAEEEEPKTKAVYQASIDNPKNGLGCWITMAACANGKSSVGTFRDTWGENNVEAGAKESACLARAQDYWSFCGNSAAQSVRAEFRPTQKYVEVPAEGCWIRTWQCSQSGYVGLFRDTWGEANVGSGSSESRCLARAQEYHVWCGNSLKQSVIAEYRPTFNKAYYPERKGCFITVDNCPKQSSVGDGFFRDTWAEDNRAAGTNELACLSRAAEIHSWCGTPTGEVVVAEYQPTLRRRMYPNEDATQIDASYTMKSVSWKEAEADCASQKKQLCMRSEICRDGGRPARGRPEGDHWLAVRDSDNQWISIGTANNNRLCKFHTEVDGGAYGKPSWGTSSSMHPTICCDDETEVTFVKTITVAKTISWSDGKQACEDQKLTLCPANVVCPKGPGNAPVGGMRSSDQWTPVSDYPNGWLSIGNFDSSTRLCRMHDALFGFPSWGTTNAAQDFKGLVSCCSKEDYCKTKPCANGGECSITDGSGFRCECKAGWKGETCKEQDPCGTSPCKNGGACANKGGDAYTCTCAAGYIGDNCEKRDPCSFAPCQNEAVCTRLGDKDYTCACKPGWEGKNCDKNIDDCTDEAKATCLNGGKCVDQLLGYSCDCAGTGFVGAKCDEYALTGIVAIDAQAATLNIDHAERQKISSNFRTPVAVSVTAGPGAAIELQVNSAGPNGGGILASFEYRGETLVTDEAWECSEDGSTWAPATVRYLWGEGPYGRVAKVSQAAKWIWLKPEAKAQSAVCRLYLPSASWKAGQRVVLPVRNSIEALCSKPTGSVTFFYGTICDNGASVQWDHMYTRDMRSGLKQADCAWSRTAMVGDTEWQDNWLGSCTAAPLMVPQLATPRASAYPGLKEEENPCTSKTCGANAACRWNKNGPMPFTCTCNAGFEGDGIKCTGVDACAKTPCDKNAVCTNTGPGTRTCQCNEGFTGTGEKCAEINVCTADPKACDANAVCTKTGPGTYTCACKDGFSGDGKTCSEIDACASSPCDDHATCAKTGPGKFSCTCNTGYSGSGKVCTAVDACSSNPCDKNAQCSKTGPGTFACACNNGYTGDGKTCTAINNCESSPCHPNAQCKMTGPGTHTCTCNKGYKGDGMTCEEIDQCVATPFPCDANAKCTKTGPGTYTCACKRGYSGDGAVGGCEEVNACSSNPCDKNAQCTKTGPGTFECTCLSGFTGTGRRCSEINACLSNPCHPDATCSKTGPGTFSCACKKGFKGDGKTTCDEMDACSSNPCDKNAQCSKTGPGTFKCACNGGYSGDGKSCYEIDNCAVSTPCDENAICKKTGPGTNSCTCRKGYVGDGVHCEEEDACQKNPCDPHATCEKIGAGTFSCTCNDGWRGTGLKCAEIDTCTEEAPCDYNADCTNLGEGKYKCACRQGFKGDGAKCEAIDDCEAVPSVCPKQSTCITTGPGTHDCQCDDGFALSADGKKCEEINACSSNPCDPNANCKRTAPGEFECQCKKGFEGDGMSCEEVDACQTSPCDSHAQCTKTGPGTYKCECLPGFTGNGMSCTEQDACSSNPCDPLATCDNTAPGQYDCTCKAGYTGSGEKGKCQEIDMCANNPNPCSANADCTKTGPGLYHCACKTGFTGNGVDCVEAVIPAPEADTTVKVDEGTGDDTDVHDEQLGDMADKLKALESDSDAEEEARLQRKPTDKVQALETRVQSLETTAESLTKSSEEAVDELKALRELNEKQDAEFENSLNSKAQDILAKSTEVIKSVLADDEHVKDKEVRQSLQVGGDANSSSDAVKCETDCSTTTSTTTTTPDGKTVTQATTQGTTTTTYQH